MLAKYFNRTMAASCARFAYLLKRLPTSVGPEEKAEYAVLAVMWMIIEVNTAICGKRFLDIKPLAAHSRMTNLGGCLVANLPCLGPILSWSFGRVSHAYKSLWAKMKERRDSSNVGLFPDKTMNSQNPGLPLTRFPEPEISSPQELQSDDKTQRLELGLGDTSSGRLTS